MAALVLQRLRAAASDTARIELAPRFSFFAHRPQAAHRRLALGFRVKPIPVSPEVQPHFRPHVARPFQGSDPYRHLEARVLHADQ